MFSFTIYTNILGNEPFPVRDMKLEDLPKKFPLKTAPNYKPETKVKGAHFVTGPIVGDGERSIENLPLSKLLVLDVDGGEGGKPASSPQECADMLCKLNINHWIYTSFSHMKEPGAIKYRVVIELDQPIARHDLRGNINHILGMMKEYGISIAKADEMYTWSQPWFLPRTPMPSEAKQWLFTDGTELEAIVTVKPEKEEAPEREEKQSGEARTIEEMTADILSGREYHESLRNLSYQFAKQGLPNGSIVGMLTAMVQASATPNDNRWMARIKDMQRLVDGAFARIEKETTIDESEYVFDDIDAAATFTSMPLFPYPNDGGRLDRSIQQVYSDMPDQCMHLAYIQTMATFATCVGASLNIFTNRLSAVNLAFILVADSGVGKSNLSFLPDFIFREKMGGTLNESILNWDLTMYLGSPSVHTPARMHHEGYECRNRLIVDTESAKAMATGAGIPEAVLSYKLEYFIKATNKSTAVIPGTRKKEAEDSGVNGYNFNIISESNGDDMGKALQGDKIHNGYLNRHSTFKVMDDEVTINKKPRNPKADKIEFDDDIKDQLLNILVASKSIYDGSKPVPDDGYVVSTLTPESLKDYYALCIEMKDVVKNAPDKVLEVVARRIAHKALKFAGLKAHIDGWDRTMTNYVIPDECWKWGKEAALYEINTIQYHLAFLDTANTTEQADELIYLGMAREFCAVKTMPNQRAAKIVKMSGVLERITKRLSRLLPPYSSCDGYMFDRLLKQQMIGNIAISTGHPSVNGKKTKVIVMNPEGYRRMIYVGKKNNVKHLEKYI